MVVEGRSPLHAGGSQPSGTGADACTFEGVP